MNLTVQFIKADKTSIGYWNSSTESILSIHLVNNAEFKKTPYIQSIITYLKSLDIENVKVVWIGIIPDIELTEFIDEFSTAPYPKIFNPFEIELVPGGQPAQLSQSSQSGQSGHQISEISTMEFRADVKLIVNHLKTYPAHPDFHDMSSKNYTKIMNYIKATLGKVKPKEYFIHIHREVLTQIKPNSDI